MTTRLDFTTADLTTCLICIREFDTRTRVPKVLHCGHTVCEECTETLRDHHTSYMSIRCPTCRQCTSRMASQQCNTNFQLMGYLAEKEKQEQERNAKGEKAPKKTEQTFQLKMGRSNKMEVHVAAKKDLTGPEMYIRKDSEGTTHVVIAGQTGSTEEILKYIDEHGLCIETGKLTSQVVYDEGRGREDERFLKVNTMGPGQSAIKSAKAPAKLEEATFKESYELKAYEENGSIKLELVRKGGEPPKNGFGVIGGCIAKPSAKRLKELTAASSNEPSTSSASAAPQEVIEEPLPKRRRCRK